MVLEFKTQAGKKPKCSRGYPCGGSCISRQRKCQTKLKGQATDFADWLKQSATQASVTIKSTKIKPAANSLEKQTSRKVKVAPVPAPSENTSKKTSSFASVDQGLRADSPSNKRLNAKLEKELKSLTKEAAKRVKQNPGLYSDNQSIISAIENSHYRNPEGTRIARSASGKIEAVASFEIKDRSLYIDFLATAPKNVDRNDPEYVRGNGTKMIVEAVKESIEKGKGGAVTLTALSGAVKFYKKLGFKPQSSLGRATPMTLSKGNAKKLLDLALNFEEVTLEDELEILELEAKGAFAGRN
jgi:hypothetical protein